MVRYFLHAILVLFPFNSFAFKLEQSDPTKIEEYISCSAKEIYKLANEQALKEFPNYGELLAETPFVFSAKNGTYTSVFVKAQFEHRWISSANGIGGSYFEHSIELRYTNDCQYEKTEYLNHEINYIE